MGENGLFWVDRGVWEHPILTDRRPFSRREAWLWMISEAAYLPRQFRVGGQTIELKRGQLAHSIRYIADKWRWPKSNVARFFDCLKTGTMIETESGTGVNIITICNYDKYQSRQPADRDTGWDTHRDKSGTAAGQQRDKTEQRNKETIDEETNVSSSLGAQARRRRAERLTDDWRPSEVDLAYADSKGLADEELSDEIEKFRNYWLAKGGRDACKLDWPKTWQTWVLNWKKFKGNRNAKPQAGNGQGISDRCFGLADALEQQGFATSFDRTRKPG